MDVVVQNRGRLPNQGRRLRPSSTWQFIFAGLLLLVAPLASSSDSTIGIKLTRIGLSLMTVLVCLGQFNWSRVGKHSRRLFGFAVYFTVGAIWSSDPIYGILNKGMFLATCLAGMVLAVALNTISDLRVGLRILLPFIAFGATAVIYAAISDPIFHYTMGRLAAFNMNANMLGQSSAAMFILCLAHIFLDRGRWRLLSASCSIVLLYIVFQTGSRSAAVMAIGGGGLICVGGFRGIARNIGLIFVFMTMLAPAFVLVGWDFASDQDPFAQNLLAGRGGRLQRDLLKDTRTEFWAYSFRIWEKNPIIGVGWSSVRHRSTTTASIYLQVLVELGIVGLIVFVVWLVGMIGWCLKLSRQVGNWPREYRVCAWVSIGCIMGLLVHGIGESSMLLGTTINPMLLGYAVVMSERIPFMLKEASQRAAALGLNTDV